jgi:hypothetical protein
LKWSTILWNTYRLNFEPAGASDYWSARGLLATRQMNVRSGKTFGSGKKR